MSKLIEVFESLKTAEEPNVKGVYFYDKEKKDIVFVYNDLIRDEHNNVYVGYRFIEDIVTQNESNSIKICSIGKIDKRIENSRYIFGGTSLDAIRSLFVVIGLFSTGFANKIIENYTNLYLKIIPVKPTAETEESTNV